MKTPWDDRIVIKLSEENEWNVRMPAKKSDQPVLWLKHQGNRCRMFFEEHGILTRSLPTVDILSTEEDQPLHMKKDLAEHIQKHGIQAVNPNCDGWELSVQRNTKKPWRVHVLGLGDVGGTLLTGLRLLADEAVEEIGIFDLDTNRRRRWAYELNQIVDPNRHYMAPVIEIEMGRLFDCDMFVFCASKAVPKVGEEGKDVRMVQYEANAQIIEIYAKMARNANFKGIFAVVSDPVDQLCKVVWDRSNRDDKGNWDGTGLLPEQGRGYGLGVMYARAKYFANELNVPFHDGRAYGPHGKDLIVANSIAGYDRQVSESLTEKTVTANLAVREVGYKPYIAPALSSGAISLLHTIWGNWHYSAVEMDGAWMGCRNRRTAYGDQVERMPLPSVLLNNIRQVHDKLAAHE